MRGLMMDHQLLVSDLIEHAALNHGFPGNRQPHG